MARDLFQEAGIVNSGAGRDLFAEAGITPDTKKAQGGLKSAAMQAVGQGVRGAGQLAADFVPGLSQDNALTRQGEEIIQANPTAVHSLEDIAAQPWTAFKEATGNAVGSMASMIGAKGIGEGIAMLPHPIAKIVGKGISYAGPVVAAGAPSYGGIRQQQIQGDAARTDDMDAKLRALGGAAAVGAIETRFGPQEWALSAMTKQGRAKLAEKFAAHTLPGAVVKGGVRGAAVEGAEELAQNPIEQVASYQDPTTQEAIKDTLFGGAMGALGGGLPGGVMGGASHAMRGGDQGEGEPLPANEILGGVPDAQSGQASPAMSGDKLPGSGETSGLGEQSQAGTKPVPGTAAQPAAGHGRADTAGPAGRKDPALEALAPRGLSDLDRVGEIDAADTRLRGRLAELNNPANGYGPMFDQERQDIMTQRLAMVTERNDLAKHWPNSVSGAPAEFTTESGARINSAYALMEADDLVASHDENLRKNQAYPQELQPRERDRAASEMQVSGIVQRLDPARLGESADAGTGAPIVGMDGLVESGNARTIALKRVYRANGLKADNYRRYLKDNAARFGLTPEQVDSMRRPVLVRVRQTPVDRAEFARQANAATVAQMSPSEQARTDAARVDNLDGLNPDENGEFTTGTSRDFIRRFMGRLPTTEQAGMIDASGALSQTGYARVRNAVLAKAYGDSPVLLRMVESLDDNTRNLTKALVRVAPRVAQVRQAIAEGRLYDADLIPDLVAAVEEISRLKDSGVSIQDYLAQTGMFNDGVSEETRDLMQFMQDNIRRPAKIAEFIHAYMDGLEALGNPNQGSLLGESSPPGKGDIVKAAKRNTDGQVSDRGATVPEGGEAGAVNRGQPGDEAGNQGGPQGNEGARRQAVDQQWNEALADLGAITRNFVGVARMLPEDTPNLMPTMVKLFESGIAKVGHNMKDLVRHVKNALKGMPEFKAVWNKIPDGVYRKAAAQAIDNAHAGEGDLFSAPVQKDLFNQPDNKQPATPAATRKSFSLSGVKEKETVQEVTQQKPETSTGTPSGQPAANTSTPSQATRSKPKTRIAFDGITGPTGAKLTGYEWAWKPYAYVDRLGEDREGRESDWDNAETNVETGRDIVHKFTVAQAGNEQTVSLETALQLLGFAESGSLSVKGVANTAKRVAKIKMAIAELEPVADAYDKAKAEVDAMPYPPITIDGIWARMGDAMVRRRSDDAFYVAGEKKTLELSWKEKRMAERGFKGIQSPHDVIADLKAKLERAERKMDEAVKAAANAPVPAQKAPDSAESDYKDRIHTLDVHEDLFKRVTAGTVTADEFKASFEALLKNKDAIVTALSAMTKDAIFKRFPGLAYRYKNEKKADVVKTAYRSMLDNFVLGNSISWSMGEKYEDVIRGYVERTNDQALADHAADLDKARAERSANREQAMAGMADPQTLEDFGRLMNAKAQEMGDGTTYQQVRMTLTPEQRARFDELAGEKTRAERKARADQQKTTVSAPSEAVGASEIIKTKHTKHGHDLWQFTLERRVPPDEFKTLVAQAKRMGGDYSSYRGNGAIPGWQFRSEDAAIAFRKLVAGDTTAAQEVMQARRDAFQDDKSQSAVERLNEMAERLEDQAAEALGRDRKANTARRARFAASAEAAANSDKALAKTMRNIAQAIADGKAKFLDRVRQKAQVEMLRGFVRSAKDDELRQKYPAYIDYEKHQGEKPTGETADHAKFPSYTAFRSDLASLGRQLEQIDGTKKLGASLLKVADDVTSAYLKFAKENLHKVSTFSRAEGKPAIFASKEQAEEAIKRSGFKGKAVVLPFKRGQNIIIMSPSAAKENGIWPGDDDKRITLTADFGAELVEKVKAMGRANRVSLPWIFESAYDARKRLSGIGIETPAEFRAALREFIALQEQPAAPDKIKEMERAMIGRRNDGLDFFPTPASVAREMVETADIKEGMTVLEPSAGMGHIAEQIREAGIDPDVVEMSFDRRELLTEKGFNLVGSDFMDVSGEYDRIVMNPPFSNRRDIEHVRHAYELLKPGGRIVAIMGEGSFFGSDKKATEFREWLDSLNGTSEKLEDGAFLDPTLPVNTGVAARMVVIDKPAEAPRLSRAIRADDFTIIENPTRDQAENLLRRSKYQSMRGLRDPETGKLYIWDANDAIHHQVARVLGITDNVYERLEFDNVDVLSKGVFSGEPGYGNVISDRPGAYDVREIRMSRAVPWYSPLNRAIQSAKRDTMPGEQWKLWIQGNRSSLGLKDDEMQFSGVLDYLSMRGKDKVTKAEIADYLSGNGVKVSDVVKGEAWRVTLTGDNVEEFNSKSAAEDRIKEENKWVDDDSMRVDADEDGGTITVADFDNNQYAYFEKVDDEWVMKEDGHPLDDYDQETFDTFEEAMDRAEEIAEDQRDYWRSQISEEPNQSETESSAKFSGYWDSSYKGGIPGTYREILVTQPQKVPEHEFASIAQMKAFLQSNQSSGYGLEGMTDLEKLKALNKARRKAGDQQKPFQSSHWEEKNILVHLRLDEVTGEDGKRYVRVGEIQSDWGQKGKKEGFDNKQFAVMYRNADGYMVRDSTTNDRAEAERDAAALEDGRVVEEKTGTPSAPFVTDTKAWVALGIKRALIHAVDVGADGIVFGTGQQNADLYDLSKQISNIKATRTLQGHYAIRAEDSGGSVVLDDVYKDSGLEDVVGKDLAEKIVNQDSGSKTYSGLDLKVGGEGMRAFYDQIVPSVANEVLKKLGGGKVGKIQVDVTDYGKRGRPADWNPAYALTGEQPGFPIPTELRERLEREGMPLFARGHGNGMAKRDLKAVVARVQKALANLPAVHVLGSPSDLDMNDPSQQRLRDFIEQAGAMDDAEGATHEGEIYLFASGLEDEARAEHVLAIHETTHYGLRAVFGKELDPVLQSIWVSNAAVRKQAQALRQKYGLASNVAAVEEVLADMEPADLVKLKGWRRLVQVVKDWLLAHGFTSLAGRIDKLMQAGMNDQAKADLLVADVVNGAREWVKSGRTGRAGAVTGTQLANVRKLADDAAEQEKWLNAEARARGYQDIDALAAKDYKVFENLARLWREKNPADVMLSRSAMKSVATNIERGLKSLAESITGKTTVHRAMFRNGLGWVDFVWGDIGKVLETGRTKGGRGLAHIVEARMRKDGLTETQAINVLGELVRTIAAGQEFKRDIVGKSTRVGVRHAGYIAWLSRLEGGNAWIVTGYEENPDGATAGRATVAPTDAAASLTRDGTVAGFNASITKLSRAGQAKTVAERADALIARPAATPSPIDTAVKAVTQATGLAKLTAAAYDKAGFFLDRYTPETIKAGVVADYGIPEAVLDQRAMMQGRMRVQLRKTGELIDKLSTLTREESRIAYMWMNADNPQASDYLMQQLPPESIQTLAEVEKMIDRLSREAVALGQLDPEAFKRNRYAYLRRSYVKHTAELTPGEAKRRGRTIAILGDQYKGRGMVEGVAMRQIQNVAPEWWGRKFQGGKADKGLKNERFIRLERREPAGEGTTPIPGIGDRTPGRVLQVAYWPASEPMPAKFKDWNETGTWEVRDTQGDKLILWRDFTAQERQAMGEIDEARFAIAKTLHGMVHDVEVGRYLEWLAQRHAKKDGAGLNVVKASEKMKDTFAPGEWVEVPDTKIPGTKVLKYGILAGRYLPGPIWNDVRQVTGGKYRPLGDVYAAILSAWKTSKTTLSPTVHTNNVMANLVMADWHDVTAGHVAKALRIMLGASDRKGEGALGKLGNLASRAGHVDREAAREIMNRFTDSGGSIGTWATAELQREQLEPMLKALEQELAQSGNSPAAQVGAAAALQHLLRLRFPSAWQAIKPTNGAKAVATEAKSMIDLYEAEDQVFRLAAWLKAKEDGADDLEAGKVARKSFLDYHINAPWIQAARQTALPFLAFTYRAVPMLLETIGKKPWKIMKLALLAGMVNALGYAMSGGDEDDERKLLPEEKAGRIWGLVPKLIRMPWNDPHGSPVFLDVRRWVPVGDVFDLGQQHAAVPILPAAVPGGPLALLAELFANKSQFTGKSIVQETDTPMEQAGKVLDHIYKAFAPNLIFLPGTYAFTSAMNAGTGKTDSFGREQSTAQAIVSAHGIKVGAYPRDQLLLNEKMHTQAMEAEISRNIAALKRERLRNGISQAEFDQAVAEQMAKKKALREAFAEKAR